MLQALAALNDRLAPAEKIFYTWLVRVFLAATLIATAWIDDAPPLELAAWIVVIAVVFRVATQFGPLVAAAPFDNQILSVLFAIVALLVLGLSFLTVVTFVELLAISVAR